MVLSLHSLGDSRQGPPTVQHSTPHQRCLSMALGLSHDAAHVPVVSLCPQTTAKFQTEISAYEPEPRTTASASGQSNTVPTAAATSSSRPAVTAAISTSTSRSRRKDADFVVPAPVNGFGEHADFADEDHAVWGDSTDAAAAEAAAAAAAIVSSPDTKRKKKKKHRSVVSPAYTDEPADTFEAGGEGCGETQEPGAHDADGAGAVDVAEAHKSGRVSKSGRASRNATHSSGGAHGAGNEAALQVCPVPGLRICCPILPEPYSCYAPMRF